MERRQLIAISGALVLFVGVFMPIVSVPLIGNINYFNGGKGDGVLILGAAILTLLAALGKRYRYLWFTGCCSLLLLLYTFFNLVIAKDEVAQEFGSDLQWGWAVLVVGSVLVLTAAGMDDSTSSAFEKLSRFLNRLLDPRRILKWLMTAAVIVIVAIGTFGAVAVIKKQIAQRQEMIESQQAQIQKMESLLQKIEELTKKQVDEWESSGKLGQFEVHPPSVSRKGFDIEQLDQVIAEVHLDTENNTGYSVAEAAIRVELGSPMATKPLLSRVIQFIPGSALESSAKASWVSDFGVFEKREWDRISYSTDVLNWWTAEAIELRDSNGNTICQEVDFNDQDQKQLSDLRSILRERVDQLPDKLATRGLDNRAKEIREWIPVIRAQEDDEEDMAKIREAERESTFQKYNEWVDNERPGRLQKQEEIARRQAKTEEERQRNITSQQERQSVLLRQALEKSQKEQQATARREEQVRRERVEQWHASYTQEIGPFKQALGKFIKIYRSDSQLNLSRTCQPLGSEVSRLKKKTDVMHSPEGSISTSLSMVVSSFGEAARQCQQGRWFEMQRAVESGELALKDFASRLEEFSLKP